MNNVIPGQSYTGYYDKRTLTKKRHVISISPDGDEVTYLTLSNPTSEVKTVKLQSFLKWAKLPIIDLDRWDRQVIDDYYSRRNLKNPTRETQTSPGSVDPLPTTHLTIVRKSDSVGWDGIQPGDMVKSKEGVFLVLGNPDGGPSESDLVFLRIDDHSWNLSGGPSTWPIERIPAKITVEIP